MSPEQQLQFANQIMSSSGAYLDDWSNSSWSHFNFTLNYPDEAAVVSKHRIWPCFFWLTFVVGMFGNWLVVYILLRKKNLRTVTNVYLLNLAVCDILYLITTIPNTSFWTEWLWGDPMCKMIQYLMGVTMAVSVLSLTAVGLDRHYAILYPISSRRHRTLPKTAFVIAIFWIFSFLLSLPNIIITRKIDILNEAVCIHFWRHPWDHKVFSTTMFVLLYAIPQSILAVCYFRIGKRLWFSMRLHTKLNRKTIQTLRTRRRVVKMVIVVTACFAVCWLPVHLAELYVAYATDFSEVFAELKLLAPLVPHVFIATNPIMYCFLSNTFRSSFKEAFNCKRVTQVISSVDDQEYNTSHRSNSHRCDREKHASGECSCDKDNHEMTVRGPPVVNGDRTSPKKHISQNGTQTSISSQGGNKTECLDI